MASSAEKESAAWMSAAAAVLALSGAHAGAGAAATPAGQAAAGAAATGGRCWCLPRPRSPTRCEQIDGAFSAQTGIAVQGLLRGQLGAREADRGRRAGGGVCVG